MHIQTESLSDQNAVVLRLRGDFDTYYCKEFLREIASAQRTLEGVGRSTSRCIVVNLRQVAFINATALGVLVKAHGRLTKEGIALRLADVGASFADLFRKIGIDRVIPIFETEEAALAE